jgi:chromosome partitioning protein
MAMFIGVVSQKGGVGKSTVCRMIATLFAAHGWNVKIADLDTKQGTCTEWKRMRDDNDIDPPVSVETFRAVSQVQKIGHNHDMIIFDGAPHSSKQTLEAAQASDLVILPTGPALDDLRPTVLLAHELADKGVPVARICFVLCRVGDSEAEIQEARSYISQAGYHAVEGELLERVGYRRASDRGLSLTEVPIKSLREKAEITAKSFVDKINMLQNEVES